MQQTTKPITTVFGDEIQLDIMITAAQRQRFPGIDKPQTTLAANHLVPSTDRYNFTRGVPHSALHD